MSKKTRIDLIYDIGNLENSGAMVHFNGLIDSAAEANIDVRYIKTGQNYGVLRRAKYLISISKRSPDGVILRYSKVTLPWVVLLYFFSRRSKIFVEFNGAAGIENPKFTNKLIEKVTIKSLSRMKSVCGISVSNGLRDYFFRRFNYKTTVINNGSSAPIIQNKIFRPSQSLKIIWFGTFQPWFDFSKLQDVKSCLSEKGINSEFTIVGDGIQKDLVTKVARDLNATVYPWMKQNDLYNLLKDQDICIDIDKRKKLNNELYDPLKKRDCNNLNVHYATSDEIINSLEQILSEDVSKLSRSWSDVWNEYTNLID